MEINYEEIDFQAIYSEGRRAFLYSAGGNPYNDNICADLWARGFMDAARNASNDEHQTNPS